MVFIDLTKVRRKMLIVICFIMILLCMAAVNEIRDTPTIVNVNDVQYKDYEGLGGKFSYKLPSGWKTKEQELGGGEILYHNDFRTEDNKIHGYVQVWNLKTPLIQFLKQSKDSAVGIVSFKNYTIEPAKIDNKEGYILQYTRLGDNKKYIKAFEVFVIDDENVFHRYAFYMDEPDWKNEYRNYLLNIAGYGKFK